MELEIKHLTPYLPYGVKVSNNTHPDDVNFVIGLRGETYFIEQNSKYAYGDIENCKILLRPLSDLTKEIEINGKKFVPIEYFFEFENPNNKIPKRMKYHYEEVPNRISISHNASSRSTEVLFSEMGANPYWMIQKLFEWHFDVFGLIDQGLALPLI